MCALFSFHCFNVWLAFVLAFQHEFYADSCNVFAIVNYRSNGLLAVFDLSSKPNQQVIQHTGCLSWTAVVLLWVSFSFSLKLSYICVWYDKSMICTLPPSFEPQGFKYCGMTMWLWMWWTHTGDFPRGLYLTLWKSFFGKMKHDTEKNIQSCIISPKLVEIMLVLL